jgi:hypothetical protein
MPELPPSALRVLEVLGSELEKGEEGPERLERPISAAFLRGGLSPLQVRRGLAQARRRKAHPDQVLAVVYEPPKTGSALIILEASELAALLDDGRGG